MCWIPTYQVCQLLETIKLASNCLACCCPRAGSAAAQRRVLPCCFALYPLCPCLSVCIASSLAAGFLPAWCYWEACRHSPAGSIGCHRVAVAQCHPSRASSVRQTNKTNEDTIVVWQPQEGCCWAGCIQVGSLFWSPSNVVRGLVGRRSDPSSHLV